MPASARPSDDELTRDDELIGEDDLARDDTQAHQAEQPRKNEQPLSDKQPNTEGLTTEPLRVAVIISSVREGRFGRTVGDWFTAQATEREDICVDVVDLAEIPLPLAMPALGAPAAPGTARTLAGLSPRLAAADAFVVVTPEYNHSFPASLKNVIDWHRAEWYAKPVGFVSYGGLAGGLRAVEQLRLVFAELHAVTVRETVSFHNAWSQFDDHGQPISPSGCNGAAKSMLDQLAWWADALHQARATRPYAA